MRLRVALLLLGFVACGGTKFTGVPDDASTGDGGGSDGGSSDGASSDGPTADGGTPCTWSAAGTTCPEGQYCEAPNCGQGTCTKTPKNENSAANVVCGCDGVTYWNDSVAHTHGMSVASNGECKSPQACNTGDKKCPNGASCNLRVGAVGACATATNGTCWVLPASCPASPRGHECQGTCDDECDLIKNEKPWFTDTALCP